MIIESLHRVLLGMHSESSWFACCSRCAWRWKGTIPEAMQTAAEEHGEIVPGGYLPKAYVEALVLNVMSPPEPPTEAGRG